MKLYMEQDPAPNPRRVAIFLREKGLELPVARIDLRKGEHKSPEHLARNSLGQVPVLELDDGRTLSESVSICRYLEALHPEPALFGVDAFDRAAFDQWIRRIEFMLTAPVGQFWRHAHPLTARLIAQHTAFGESNRERVADALRWLDGELGRSGGCVAGEAFGMADIVAVTTLDFAELIGLETPGGLAHLEAWRARMGARPSMATAPIDRQAYRAAPADASRNASQG